MRPRWRWAIAAGVAMLLAVVLYFRLDAGRMRKALPPLVSGLTHATIDFDHLSFSFVHGLDVRLDKVRMQHASWKIEAPTALLELRVVPLLLGKIELQGIYLLSPVIRFAPQEGNQASVMEKHGLLRNLMLDRLSVSDATLMSDRGLTWISGLDMDIQDIGPSRTMRWELQARTGEQTAVGHGQLSLKLGTIDSGFGKLSLERIPLQALRSLSRISGLTKRFSLHGYSQLSSVLTMSIGHDDQWTLFGETTLSGGTDRPKIQLRGRLYRDTAHALGWKDSFIQVGSDAALAIEGSCDAGGACTTAIRGKSVDLTPLAEATAPITPIWQPISGSVDMQADLRWRHKNWNLTGQAEAQGVTWQDAAGKFALPDFRLSDLLVSGLQTGFRLKSARIGFVKQSGSLLASGHDDLDGRTGSILLRLDGLQNAWAPVLRLALMVTPAGAMAIGGQGVMQGSVELAVADGRPDDLKFSLDGTKAAIRVDDAQKPAGVAAVASGDWQPGTDDAHLVVTSATLGTSTLKGLLWQRTKTRQALEVKGIKLDMQALRKQGVHFPASLKPFQGSLSGNLSTSWDIRESAGLPPDLWAGLPGLTARLDLERFGTSGWQLQGHLAFDRGRSILHELALTGAHGNAELGGDISFASMRGHVDIHQGTLAWKSGDAVPAWLTAMHLRGRINGLDVSWLGQAWKGVKARYRLDGAYLRIPALKVGLADGMVSGRDLAFGFQPGALTLSGFAQVGAMHAQKLSGLADALRGRLTGKAFATIKFDGTLPFKDWQDWRNDGNVMIYGGSWRPEPLKGVVQAIHRFDLFGFRFRSRHGRTSIKHLQFESDSGRYTGTAALGTTGTLQGQLTRRKDGAGFALGGAWPHVTWTPVPTH